jgi:hypothetical protein
MAEPDPARYPTPDKTWILRTLRTWGQGRPAHLGTLPWPTSSQLAKRADAVPEHMRRQLEQLERDGYVRSTRIGRQRSRRWAGLTS